MSEDKYAGIEEIELGVQDDGEPAVEPPKAPEPTPEPAKAEPHASEPGVKPEPEVKPEDNPEQPHKKTGSQRARERAEREAALRMQAERERDELRAQLEGLNKPTVDPTEPQLENFEDLASWKAALTEHASKKAAADAEAKFKADQQEREFEAKQASWREADAKFSATKPDWDDAMEDLQEVVQGLNPQNAPGFGALDAALSTSDIAPALKYHLGKNPEEFRHMASLDPIGAVKALARLEIRLSEPKQPTTETKPPSKAPLPVRPVAGSAAVVTDTRFGGIEEF